MKSSYHRESLTWRLTDNFPMVDLRSDRESSVCLCKQKAGSRAALLTDLFFETLSFFSTINNPLSYFQQHKVMRATRLCVFEDLLRRHRLVPHIIQGANPLETCRLQIDLQALQGRDPAHAGEVQGVSTSRASRVSLWDSRVSLNQSQNYSVI